MSSSCSSSAQPPNRLSQWVELPCDETAARHLASNLGLSLEIARLLAMRGFEGLEQAKSFLDPRLRSIEDPFAIHNLAQAVARTRKAMARNEEILVFGDYDVDGVTSTAFLVSILNLYGIKPRYLVPLRMEEGYGLSIPALERALSDPPPPSLLITVDCGTNSREEVAWLRERGIDVIILDHHTTRGLLPEDCILVNPHVHDGADHPWSNLCAVGLVFKFIHGLLKQLREEGDELAHQIQLRDYLDLVAMGTVSDLVPLVGENRVLAKAGLSHLRSSRRPGINALFEVSGVDTEAPLSPFDISFRLGPRINACGRLADASLPINMLLSQDWQDCLRSAQMLDALNRERQEIEKGITEAAQAMVEAHHTTDAAYVLHHPDWHPGVVGIVASRIVQQFHRPCLVLGRDGASLKGSGRTVPGISLVEALRPCASLLESWGGHPMAVGLSLAAGKVEDLRTLFRQSVENLNPGGPARPTISLSGWIDPARVTARLLDELELLAPFGQGNPEPVFGIRRASLLTPPTRFGNGHLRFFLENGGGQSLPVVAWKKADHPPPVGPRIDLAFRLAWNRWNGQSTPQATLVDWRMAENS